MSSYRKIPNPHWMDDDLSRLDLFDGRRPSAPYLAEPTHGQSIVDNDRRRRMKSRAGKARRELIQEWALVIAILALIAVATRLVVILS